MDPLKIFINECAAWPRGGARPLFSSTASQLHSSTAPQLHRSTAPQLHSSTAPQLRGSKAPQLRRSAHHPRHTQQVAPHRLSTSYRSRAPRAFAVLADQLGQQDKTQKKNTAHTPFYIHAHTVSKTVCVPYRLRFHRAVLTPTFPTCDGCSGWRWPSGRPRTRCSPRGAYPSPRRRPP